MLLLLSYLIHLYLKLLSKTRPDKVNKLGQRFVVSRTNSLSLNRVNYHNLWKKGSFSTDREFIKYLRNIIWKR